MNKITELEADFGVIRATRQKVVTAIPYPFEPESCGFSICPFFELAYEYPTFTMSVYADYGVIPAPRWAMFEVIDGKWFVLETGDYAQRVDEMLNVLISVFGGERG